MKIKWMLILFLFLNSYASDTEYVNVGGISFPAVKQSKVPVVNIESKLTDQKVDISFYNNKSLKGYDHSGSVVLIPERSQLLMQLTLDQIYDGYQQTPAFDSFFSQSGNQSAFNIESPDALKIKAILNQLITLKMQEEWLDEAGVTGAMRDELIEVRVKKEGELEKKVKVKLKEALEDNTIVLNETEIEAAPYRLPGDYDGSETWTPERKLEAGDILKCLVGCNKDKEPNIGLKIATQTMNQIIQKRYAAYSEDKKTQDMIKYALTNIRDPEEYKKSKNGKCYKYTKNALVHAKLVSSRPEGVSPRYAGEQLISQGFKNILDDRALTMNITDPNQAPKGAILVYEPSPVSRLINVYDKEKGKNIVVPDYGHIEIKTENAGEAGFVSDYKSKNARTGKSLESKDRKLIGIYVKMPDEKS